MIFLLKGDPNMQQGGQGNYPPAGGGPGMQQGGYPPQGNQGMQGGGGGYQQQGGGGQMQSDPQGAQAGKIKSFTMIVRK